MIKFRRIHTLGHQYFLSAMFAWEKADDGRVYYAAEAIPREFLSDVLRDHGVAALRRFFIALKSELAETVRSRENVALSDAQAVDVVQKPRTYERMCEMLGIEPKDRGMAN